MDESSAKRSFPTGMVTLLGLGLIGIGLWIYRHTRGNRAAEAAEAVKPD